MLNAAMRERIYQRVKSRLEEFRQPGRPSSAMCLYHGVLAVHEIRACGTRAILQAGTTQWRMRRRDQDDGVSPTHFGYVWSPRDFDWARINLEGEMPEIHVWAAIPQSREIVDLSAGDFPEQARTFLEQEWLGEPPPRFLWTTELPEGAIYEANPEATALAIAMAIAAMGKAFCRDLGIFEMDSARAKALLELAEKVTDGPITLDDLRVVGESIAMNRLRIPKSNNPES